MPTTFITSFPVARCCTGTKRVVGSDPHKIMPFLLIFVRKWPREAIFVAHCLSGSGGVAPYSLIPPGRFFYILSIAFYDLTTRPRSSSCQGLPTPPDSPIQPGRGLDLLSPLALPPNPVVRFRWVRTRSRGHRRLALRKGKQGRPMAASQNWFSKPFSFARRMQDIESDIV